MSKLFDENSGLSINQVLRKIASQLGVEYNAGEIKVLRNDREFQIFIYHGKRGYRVGASSFFEIKTRIPHPHPFFGIKKSDSFGWIAEHILCMPDFQVGDKDFDANYHVKVDDNNWGNEFFSHSTIKNGLSDLLLLGFDVIRSEDGDLKAVIYLPIGGPYPSVEIISRAMEKLDQITTNFPSDYAPPKINKQTSDLFNYSSEDMTKDLGEANHEFLFGNMEEKSRQRTMVVLLIVLILAAIAFWRLSSFMVNSPNVP
jgi:hypothetical protein